MSVEQPRHEAVTRRGPYRPKTRLLTCPRCGRQTMQKDWPREVGGAHLLKTCCRRAECGKSPHELRANDIARKRKSRAVAAQRLGRAFYPRTAEGRAQRELAKQERADRDRAALENARAALHDAHVRALRMLSSAERYRWRYRNDPAFAVHERVRRQLRKKAEAVPGLAEAIRQAIKQGRSCSAVEMALGYTVAELKVHIERQFTKGMSWDAWTRGGIHIDHILPRKCFEVATLEGIRAYWALTNLRPLWAKHNLQKQAKVQFLL